MNKRKLIAENKRLMALVETLTAENQRLNDLIPKVVTPKKQSKKYTNFDIKYFAENAHKADKNKSLARLIHYENGIEVFTNGKFLIENKTEYNSDYEGKNLDFVKNEVLECGFPKWKAVIPDDSNLEICNFIDLKQMPIIRKLTKVKSWSNLKKLRIKFYSEDLNFHIVLPMNVIDIVNEFCKYSTNCNVHTVRNGFDYNGTYTKPIVIKSDDRQCIAMPMLNANDEDCFAVVKNGKIFLQNNEQK